MNLILNFEFNFEFERTRLTIRPTWANSNGPPPWANAWRKRSKSTTLTTPAPCGGSWTVARMPLLGTWWRCNPAPNQISSVQRKDRKWAWSIEEVGVVNRGGGRGRFRTGFNPSRIRFNRFKTGFYPVYLKPVVIQCVSNRVETGFVQPTLNRFQSISKQSGL